MFEIFSTCFYFFNIFRAILLSFLKLRFQSCYLSCLYLELLLKLINPIIFLNQPGDLIFGLQEFWKLIC